ncbi:Fic family protein [Patescibacteria group bacterium]|nr:Fic family protein [Patescibacteria group bacterium]
MVNDSTKPSGATSYKQTAFGIIPRSQLLQLELEGTKKGLEFIYTLVKAHAKVDITPALIRQLHSVSFGWIFPEWAGAFRTIQVTYSGKEAPNYFQVPELIENLCADLRTRLAYLPKTTELGYIENVVSLLAWFQHQFVFIHPFQDYNGRTGRMLTSLLLLNLKLPATEIQIETEADRQHYLQAMQRGDENDLTVLEKLIGEALLENLNHP